MSTYLLRRAPRALALGVAAATAAALGLTAPATAGADETASPWPQTHGGADNTLQGVVAGPDDPGLKWLLDLGAVETADAPDGYSVGSSIEGTGGEGDLNRPLVAADGTLILRADNNADDRSLDLVGIDPDDGEVAWATEIGSALRDGRCTQAIDGDNRLWTYESGDLVALDPATGEELADTRVEPDVGCVPIIAGGDPEHLVLVHRNGVEAWDISATTPTPAWDVSLGEAGLPDDWAYGSDDPRAVVTDDTVYLAGLTEDGDDETLEVVALSLADGTLTDRVELPTFDGPAGDLSVRALHADGTLVVGASRGTTGSGDGYLAAFDLDLDEQWVAREEDASGPTRITLGDGAVHADTGSGEVVSRTLSDGSEQWRVDHAGGRYYWPVSDADGRVVINTTTQVTTGIDNQAITAVSPEGVIEWRATRAVIRQVADRTGDGEGLGTNPLRLGPIDADGTLYAFRGGVVIAIDDSGGLEVCELPFADVDTETNVHANNICRLVQAQITAGIDEDNYGPSLRVTREQMATFLTRALGLTPREGDQFTDVDPESVHARNIYALVDAGITAGVTDTTFDPSGNLRRDQMATFLARAAELDPVDGTGFVDVDADNVHRENIYAVRDADITQGVGGNRFDPSGQVRRDQMASFLMRMVDFLAEQD